MLLVECEFGIYTEPAFGQIRPALGCRWLMRNPFHLTSETPRWQHLFTDNNAHLGNRNVFLGQLQTGDQQFQPWLCGAGYRDEVGYSPIPMDKNPANTAPRFRHRGDQTSGLWGVFHLKKYIWNIYKTEFIKTNAYFNFGITDITYISFPA